MATKKKTTKLDPEVKALKADVRYLGKEMTKMRVACAQALGASCAAEDKVKILEAGQKEFATKLRKLIADPIYSVPDRLKKEVEKLATDTNASLVQIRSRVYEVERQVKEKPPRTLTKRMDSIESKMEEMSGQLYALEEVVPGTPAQDDLTTIDSAPEALDVDTKCVNCGEAFGLHEGKNENCPRSADGNARESVFLQAQVTLEEAIARIESKKA